MTTKSYHTTSDQQQIDHLITLFFSIFTNTEQQVPDFSIIQQVCIPETIIIKKTGTRQVVYNLDSFIEPRKIILTDGTLTSFEEKEISEKTTIICHIAQRYSRYQKTGNFNGKQFMEYGHKFFQVIKTEVGWRINALIWEDDISN